MYNANSYWGRALLDMIGGTIPAMGNIFVVCPASDGNYAKLLEVVKDDPFGGIRLFTTVEEAYNATTSNNNDVIVLSANATHTLTGMLTVSKNRVHFIGMDGGGRKNSQGSKIATPATSVAGNIAVIYNTGVRNSFRNIKFIQQGTNAAQLYGFIDAGEGTYAENCHFDHTTLLSTANVASLLFAGDTCHYKNCQIGGSTVYRTGNPANAMLVGKYGSAYARYSYFEDCEFVAYSSQTASRLVGTTGNDHVIGWIRFNKCGFNNAKLGDGATAGAEFAAGIVSALTSGYLQVDNNCSFFNVGLSMNANGANLNAAGAAVAAADGGKAIKGA